MKKYETYKESGVNWIGKIPENWVVTYLKFVVNYVKTGSTPPTINNSYYHKGNIPWYGPGDFNSLTLDNPKKYVTQKAFEDGKCRIFEKNSILLIGIGATVGKVGITKSISSANQQINAINFDELKMKPSFALYYLSSIKNIIVSKADSATLPIFNQTQTKELKIVKPTLKEQTQIANYLDHKTQIIDALIEKKEQLTKKLQAQRQAIINEAVTKGLNKNVPLKDSGIEWLGKIPEHWEVVKLKFIGDSITGITYSPNDVSEKGTLVLRSSNIQNGELALNDTVYVNKTIAEKYITRKDDILLCSRNGSRNLIGKNIIIDERVENQSWGAFMTVYRSDYNDFMYYFFNSDIFSGLSSLFLSSTINQLTIGVINNMQIALPKDENERKEIISLLKIQTKKLNKGIDLNKKQIQKLKSYRQSIISEAVTGKIDVRDWQAPKK